MAIPSILYHYCSTEAFVAITEHQTIRLTALSLSNDSLEGKLVRATVTRMANDCAHEVQERLTKCVESLERLTEALGFCLSTEDDLLSQWRGYADNGKGVAIGFETSGLEQLRKADSGTTTHFLEVRYDEVEHENAVRPAFDALCGILAKFDPFSAAKALERPRPWSDDEPALEPLAAQELIESVFRNVSTLIPPLYQLKSSGFREESEWRLVRVLLREAIANCKFRARSGAVVPFMELSFQDAKPLPIARIVLGPSHPTSTEVVQAFLLKHGLPNATVERSRLSYRTG